MILKKIIKSFVSVLKVIQHIFENIIKLFKGLIGYLTLIDNNYVTNFLHENNTKIHLPKISLLSVILNPKKLLKRSLDYFSRPQTEVLLRKTIFNLYEQKYIDPKKSVIDIGCWIADNSLVWAKMLEDDAIVFAIDPSTENLSFGKNVAALNNIFNVKWVRAVCSDKPDIAMSYDGSIHMAQFKIDKESNSSMVSTTLDKIADEKSGSIGLMHVDVEGFELKVLQGAGKIIELSRPVILFEQHISKEDVGAIINFLHQHKYDIYMINEVLPGCDLDCRNFIAFDSKREPPKIKNMDQKTGRELDIFHASIGPQLIKVT
tara:strand:+ start:232 stop:1185 length:954 start_codon:yes stop_codon:yes gene_type:complete